MDNKKTKLELTWKTIHAKTYNGKPWTYLLIPHDQIAEQMSLSGLAASCTHKSQGQGTGSQGKE